jgi:iron-sulfur cluster assembly accessory protein
LTLVLPYLSGRRTTTQRIESATMTLSVTLTERAAERIKEIVADDLSKPNLRISVEGGGCSGFSYKFDLVPAAEADDIKLERAGATVLIDPVSLEYLSGSQIDFVDDLMGAAFRITNPNATASCGCGNSFAL